jgi:plastocyanin
MGFPLRRPVAAALLAGLVVACGGDDTSTAPSSGPPCADNCVTIVADNVLFKTKEVEAKAGTITIKLDNKDSVVHNVTVKTPDGDKQVVQGRGDRATTGTIDLPAGTYDYVCTIPGHGNMKGKLTVK